MTYWTDKRVLVTGGTGMVGSHVIEKLINSEAEVVTLTRSHDPKAYFFTERLSDRAILANGDIRDYRRIVEIIGKYEIEHIFHLAAQPIVTTALWDPFGTFQTNVSGTVSILEAARARSDIKSIVVASSDKAYGQSRKLPYVEEMPLCGGAPYEASKSCTDIMSTCYAKTYGMPIAVTRFGNIYGPGDLNLGRIIPGSILAGMNGETLKIRSNGKMIREYLYVGDVAEGYLQLAERIKLAAGEAFNFGSGEKLSVLEVVDLISKVMGKKIDTKILNIACNEIPEQYLSSEKIAKRIGWTAKHSFDEGLKKTIPWYKKIFG
ncbi:GDP-mannose 4,6-dehydratase [Candidatus Micrarchaeota archaeon]|nr:GDP-mannose 4,6-dehydratase [Candidatus Micrarchaeota archaeon]